MAQRVLPALRVLAVERKVVHDELVDLAEGQHLLVRALDGHGRQSDVGVGRLLLLVAVAARARHLAAGDVLLEVLAGAVLADLLEVLAGAVWADLLEVLVGAVLADLLEVLVGADLLEVLVGAVLADLLEVLARAVWADLLEVLARAVWAVRTGWGHLLQLTSCCWHGVLHQHFDG